MSALHVWSSSWRSGAGGEGRSLVLGEAHGQWQDDGEAVEESGLCGIGLGDATQTYLAVGGGWQHDIIRLNARELFEHGSWGIAETSAALPHLEALPQHEGEKADEDMCLHAILALVPDGTKVELVFLDAESSFGLGELDIGFPELSIPPILDVRTQHLDAPR